MARRLRVSVDRNKCVGSTICVLITPKVFGLNENGQSTVMELEGATEESILEAATQCPLSAITVQDAETGERLFPLPD